MKRILVVDDSAICREPISAMLRMQGYEAIEAENGQTALLMAQSMRPHLILLDLNMPIMGGLECARALRGDPKTAAIPVIMLTATAERTVVEQAAHCRISGFLLKSRFSSTELISRVQSLIGPPGQAPAEPPAPNRTVPAPPPAGANHVGASVPIPRMTKSGVLTRLEQEIELRSIKPVLEYVIALTRSGSSTLEQVADAIRQDQALAVRVLRIANSSFYQRSHDARSPLEAAQRMGMTAIRNTVIAILAIDHFEDAGAAGLVPQRFWEHSLVTGVLAEAFAEVVSPQDSGQLFLAGLLHDIGRMLLATVFPKEYAACLARADDLGGDLESAEREVFELSHAEATRHLLTQWKMPASIVEAAWPHALPLEKLRALSRGRQCALIVASANRIAHALAIGCSGDLRLWPYLDLVSELGLDSQTLQGAIENATKKTTDLAMFYAAHSRQQFADPFLTELARSIPVSPRIAILGQDASLDPLALFLQQIGWVELEAPQITVFLPRSENDFVRFLPNLKKFDAARGTPIPVLMACTGPEVKAPAEWSFGRVFHSLSLPCRYAQLIEAVHSCIQIASQTPADISGR